MALDITPERVDAAVARLTDGGWRFNGRQLYYAVCRDVEVPPVHVAPGEIGLGVLLILVGAITGQRIAFAALGAVGLLVVIIGVVTRVSERRPQPDSRVLAVSFDSFATQFLDGNTYDGLVEGTTPPPAAAEDSAVVVCDRADTAAMLRANATRVGTPVRIEEVDALQTLPAGSSVVVVHDASPAGCAIAAEARDHGLTVTDAGLNPGEVAGRRLQVIEGAPARLPRDLSGQLAAAELDWLIGGRRLELATLTPEQVVLLVRAALH